MRNTKLFRDDVILQLLDENVSKNPSNDKSYAYRAGFYSCINSKENAVKDYEKAISIQPTFDYYFKEALIKCNSKTIKYSSAEILTDYNNALSLASNNGTKVYAYLELSLNKTNQKYFGYRERAKYYSKIGEYDKAVLDMDSSIDVGHPDVNDYLKRADYKDHSGKYKPEAILKDLEPANELKKKKWGNYDEEIYDRLMAKYGN